MSFSETVYYNSPKLVQEILIFLKSASLHYKYEETPKTSLEYQSVANICSETLSKEIINRQNIFLQEACKHTPYYIKQLKNHGVSPADINVNNFTEYLPVISNQTIRDSPSDFISQIEKPSKYIYTSGSSGQPMKIAVNERCRRLNYLFFNAILAMHDVHPKDSSVVIGGKPLFNKRKITGFWQNDRFSNTLYLSNYDLSHDNYHIAIKKIESKDPAYIESYPFPIAQLANWLISKGNTYQGKKLKLIITSSEMLTVPNRKAIEKAFDCEVISQYGSAEMASFGYSVGENFYFPSLYAINEFLPVNNSANKYEITSTSLVNSCMPLLRYKTGDFVSHVKNVNAFGATTSDVLGREDDALILPDGRAIYGLNPIAAVTDVNQAQIIQRSDGSILINVIPLDNRSPALLERVRKNAALRLGKEIEVKCQFANKLRLSNNGKFKFSIRESKN